MAVVRAVARDPPGGRRGQRRLGFEDLQPAQAGEQFTVAEPAPVLGGQVQQDLAGPGGRPAQPLPRLRQGPAAERAVVRRAQVGVPLDQVDRAGIEAQLLRDQQPEGRAVVLAHVDLAGERGRRAGRGDVHPGPADAGRRGPHHDQPVAQDVEVLPVPRVTPVPGTARPGQRLRGFAAGGFRAQPAGLPEQDRGPPDRAGDPRVTAAPADGGLEGLGDGSPVRTGIGGQQRGGPQRHGGGAVPALEGVLFGQGLLDRMQPPPRGQPLDGRDRTACHLGRRRLAGQHRRAVDQHGARGARAFPAARLGAGQAESGAQPREQGPGRRRIQLVPLAVHDGTGHGPGRGGRPFGIHGFLRGGPDLRRPGGRRPLLLLLIPTLAASSGGLAWRAQGLQVPLH